MIPFVLQSEKTPDRSFFENPNNRNNKIHHSALQGIQRWGSASDEESQQTATDGEWVATTPTTALNGAV